MGKGFENYMSKKWFHPTNIENQKRKYLAEQKAADEKKRQMELRQQYEREQEVFSNKQLMGDEKARLGLSFIYNAPTSLKDQQKQQQQHGDHGAGKSEPLVEPEAPSAASRVNARCIKCKRMGHLNTDKTCPLYGKSRLDVEVTLAEDSLKEASSRSNPALKTTDEGGSQSKQMDIKLEKKDADEHEVKDKDNDDDDDDGAFSLEALRTLPPKDKKLLLKRLRKLAKKLSKTM